jgi:hypothetical protein
MVSLPVGMTRQKCGSPVSIHLQVLCHVKVSCVVLASGDTIKSLDATDRRPDKPNMAIAIFHDMVNTIVHGFRFYRKGLTGNVGARTSDRFPIAL